MSQDNNPSNNQNPYDQYEYYFNKIPHHKPLNVDEYNFSAGDYSEDIDTDLETPVSMTSSKLMEANRYLMLHQNSTVVEPQETKISNQNPISTKINQSHNMTSQRHYLPHHTTIVPSSQYHHNPADVTEIYRRRCNKSNLATRMQQQRPTTQLMLSGSPTTDQNQQHQHRQQQPHLVLRRLPTPPREEQQIYTNNNSRNYSCRYCAEVPTHNQQKPSTKRYVQHCVAVDTPESVIEYYEDDLLDEYSDVGGEYDDITVDIPTATYHEHNHCTNNNNNNTTATNTSGSRYHQYPHSSPQLLEMRDIQRTIGTTTTPSVGISNENTVRNGVPLSSTNAVGTATVKSAVRGSSSPPINGNNNGFGSCNITSRIQNTEGNNIRHRCKTSREYASHSLAPIPVSSGGINNTDQIPPLMRPHSTPGDVIQTSQVHYHLTPHPSHRQRHRTTVLAPRYYRRTTGLTTNVGGTALHKPPSKLCLPVLCQPEYPALTSSAAAQRKYRTIHHIYNNPHTRSNRPHRRISESINEEGNNLERVEYEPSPATYYTTTEGSYNVIQPERIQQQHQKRKLKNKLTLKNPKRDVNSIEEIRKNRCDMDAVLAHFETLFDMKEKEFIDEISSKENIKNSSKIPHLNNNKSIKSLPVAVKKSRIPSSALKLKQESMKKLSCRNLTHTKLKKCDSTTSQQTVITEIRTKKKLSHDKNKTENHSLKVNDNKNMIDASNNTRDNNNNTTSKNDYILVDQHRTNNIKEVNTDSFDKLFAELMASGYINQEQHDKSKSINQKMRDETQRMLSVRSSCSASPTATPSKRLNDCTTRSNTQLIDVVGKCMTTAADTTSGADNIINSTTNKSIHEITATTCKIAIATPTISMSPPLNNNTTQPNVEETKNNQTASRLLRTPEKLQTPDINLLSKTDLMKNMPSEEEHQLFTNNSSQTNQMESKSDESSSTVINKLNEDQIVNINKFNMLPMGTQSKSINRHQHQDEDRQVALELHRSKSYIINLIDRALSKELGTKPETGLSEKCPCTTQHRVLLNTNDVSGNKVCGDYNIQPSENITHVTDAEMVSEMASALNPENYVPKNSAENTQEKPSTSSMNAEEPPYLKHLKQLRWGHLKHIQEEIQRLQDLEKFLDSCSTNTPSFFQSQSNTKK